MATPSFILFEKYYLEDFVRNSTRSDMSIKILRGKNIILISPNEDALVSISKQVQTQEMTLAKSIITERSLRILFADAISYPRIDLYRLILAFTRKMGHFI